MKEPNSPVLSVTPLLKSLLLNNSFSINGFVFLENLKQ